MSKTTFQKTGYTTVKNAISSELRDFVTQYALFDEMQNYNPDQVQVKGAHAQYADPAMEAMLLHLHPLMEKNTGLELDPTYSFYRVYRPGDELVKHSDRESCEISCTVFFNCQYNNEDYNWPIFIDGSAINQTPGDLAIYRGCDLQHWREPLKGSESNWHVQGFFHYVDKNGPYANFKYDGRPMIGELKNTPTPTVSNKSYIVYTQDNR